jgi:hypothetical protein
MGERKAESASARGLHRLKELSLASDAVVGRAWGVALGVSTILEGWARRTAFTVTLCRSGVRSLTNVSEFCKPLHLKQSYYISIHLIHYEYQYIRTRIF